MTAGTFLEHVCPAVGGPDRNSRRPGPGWCRRSSRDAAEPWEGSFPVHPARVTVVAVVATDRFSKHFNFVLISQILKCSTINVPGA